MNKQQEPRLRFQGFTGAWEEKKLEDIFNTIRNAFVGTATPYYVENGHFYLESNNIKNGEINKNSQIFINDEFYYKQQDKWLKTNDLVMVQSGHVGHCAVIPEELNNVAAHALIMFSNYKLEANPYFLSYQFQTNSKIGEIAKITTGNTIKHILSSDMKEFVVDFTMVEEQTAIGNFFRRLDSQIAESRAVLGKSRQLKKAMLAKMFPANGEKIPKIRFKGFEGEWETYQICDLFRITRGNVLATTNLVDNKNEDYCYPVYSSQTKNKGLMGYWKHYLFENAITWTTDGANAGDVNFRSGKFYCTNVCGVLINEEGFANQCIAEILNLVTHSYVSYVGNPKLMNNVMAEIPILIPPTIKEQTAIGNFFRQLDETIALQSAEVEKLNQLKKGLLAAMLV